MGSMAFNPVKNDMLGNVKVRGTTVVTIDQASQPRRGLEFVALAFPCSY